MGEHISLGNDDGKDDEGKAVKQERKRRENSHFLHFLVFFLRRALWKLNALHLCSFDFFLSPEQHVHVTFVSGVLCV